MFANFISLGEACQTASSMSKYGLRSWSGPFDWLVTDSLPWVLKYMETDFKGFLEKENLERCKDRPKVFIEKKSGFEFRHDYELPFETRYDELRRKYQKKIDRFLAETIKPTCFLRTVISLDEIRYINENHKYIKEVIEKKNNQSEIIFLIRKDVKMDEEIPFRHYVMPGIWNGGPEAIIRTWFDGADEFLRYCYGCYDILSVIDNIEFDRNKEEKRNIITQTRYQTLLKLVDFDFSNVLLPDNIVIYRAGNIGKKFYDRIKEKCNVQCFVDKKEAGNYIGSIPIKRIEELACDENLNFIVTATYDFENISQHIRLYNNSAEIISLDSILDSHVCL